MGGVSPSNGTSGNTGRAAAVSIVMPAFNVEGYIEGAVASARRQSFTDFELVAVDDGSTDATGRLLDRLASGRSPIDPSFKVIHQPNRGAAAARNAGIRASTAPLIAFLDGDDEWRERLLEPCVALLERHSDVDLVFPQWIHVDARGRETGARGRTAKQRLDFADLFVKNPIHSCTGVVVRRCAVERAGGFDEALDTNVDYDLWLRIGALRPRNIAAVHEAAALYRHRPGQLTDSWRRMAGNWEAVLTKCRDTVPELVADLEHAARANQCIYWSTLARRAGEDADARRLMLRAWRASPATMLRSSHAWATTLATLAAVLPSPMRETISRWTRAG